MKSAKTLFEEDNIGYLRKLLRKKRILWKDFARPYRYVPENLIEVPIRGFKFHALFGMFLGKQTIACFCGDRIVSIRSAKLDIAPTLVQQSICPLIRGEQLWANYVRFPLNERVVPDEEITAPETEQARRTTTAFG